ncbi:MULTISPECIES: immunoglobulin-like domain-containing protein [Listeria]|uniref:immunoglobulin-like domain-containing protein n=1 Tax=Listeria TaxID=1637 RepID=UPI000B592782|nr:MULTISPECIES: immunoglobulin-like domain-containing protein [Listeria]
MKNKKAKLRKLSVSIIAATVFVATVMTTLPHDVLATETNQEVVNVDTETNTNAAGTIIVNQDFYVGTDSRIQAEATGAVTRVYLEVDGLRKATIPVAGSFEYYARPEITDVNQDVYLVGLDSSNQQLARTKVTLRSTDTVTGGAITVNPYTVDQDRYITGTYTGDVKYVALEVKGVKRSRVPVTGGSYEYYARLTESDVNTDQVYIIAYDSKNVQIASEKVTLLGTDTGSDITNTLTVNPYTVNQDRNITGTYTGDIKYVALEVKGIERSKMPVTGGSYEYYARLTESDVNTNQVYIIAYDAKNAQIAREKVTLLGTETGSDITSTLTVNPFTVNQDRIITGTYTGDVRYVAIEVKGVERSKVPVTGGSFECYARLTETYVNTDQVYIVAYDSKIVRTTREKVTLLGTDTGSDITSTLTVNPYMINQDRYVTGTYTGDVKYVALEVKGVKRSKVPVTGGSYQYYARLTETDANTDQMYMIGYDSSGAEVSKTKVALNDTNSSTGSISAYDYTVNQDKYVSGTYTGDVQYVSLEVNGATLSKVPVATDGKYRYYARPNITNGTTDKVYVIGYDSKGTVIAREEVKLYNSGSTTCTITANDYTIDQDKYVSGTYTGNVRYVALKVNGVTLSKVPVTAGNYSYYARPQITSMTDIVSIIAYDSASIKVSESTVAILVR